MTKKFLKIKSIVLTIALLTSASALAIQDVPDNNALEKELQDLLGLIKKAETERDKTRAVLEAELKKLDDKIKEVKKGEGGETTPPAVVTKPPVKVAPPAGQPAAGESQGVLVPKSDEGIYDNVHLFLLLNFSETINYKKSELIIRRTRDGHLFVSGISNKRGEAIVTKIPPFDSFVTDRQKYLKVVKDIEQQISEGGIKAPVSGQNPQDLSEQLKQLEQKIKELFPDNG